MDSFFHESFVTTAFGFLLLFEVANEVHDEVMELLGFESACPEMILCLRPFLIRTCSLRGARSRCHFPGATFPLCCRLLSYCFLFYFITEGLLTVVDFSSEVALGVSPCPRCRRYGHSCFAEFGTSQAPGQTKPKP